MSQIQLLKQENSKVTIERYWIIVNDIEWLITDYSDESGKIYDTTIINSENGEPINTYEDAAILEEIITTFINSITDSIRE
jgi:hypothetical protein